MSSVLHVDDVSVRFGGVEALDDVSLRAGAGEITGLIGPNGAGKTTLFNVITGLTTPDRGVVRIHGDDVTSTKPHRRARLGVARTFQRLEVFGSVTVRDNVLIGAESTAGHRDGTDPADVAERTLDRVGLQPLAEARVSELPTGTLRLVELARALATRPTLLLLDEPASGLTERETEGFGDLLLALAAEGLAILLVEHDVESVMRLCSLVHVLDFGRLISVGTPDEVQADAEVRRAYLGAEVAEGAA